jgi:hypothetical protein
VNRAQLEHLIRAAGTVSDDPDLVIVGSQAILGAHPDAPRSLRASDELDLYPRNHPDRSDVVDGALGEMSAFHRTFGYYAQGVGPETAVVAPGWEARLVPVRNENTRGITGWCLEPHDLVLAKLVAGREKDLDYAREALRHRLVRRRVLEERLSRLPVDEAVRAVVATRIAAAATRPGD